jgi:hypothetical protein
MSPSSCLYPGNDGIDGSVGKGVFGFPGKSFWKFILVNSQFPIFPTSSTQIHRQKSERASEAMMKKNVYCDISNENMFQAFEKPWNHIPDNVHNKKSTHTIQNDTKQQLHKIQNVTCGLWRWFNA